MKSTMNIMIYAYTRLNLGDDILILTLCERYPDVQFLLYAPECYKNVFSCCRNLTIHPSNSIKSRIVNALGRLLRNGNFFENSLARKCNACVCITGSLFIQRAPHWEDYFRYIEGRSIPGIPYFLLGANFGPYNDDDFYRAYQRLFASYADVCFREKHSYELFRGLPNSRFATDVVFANKSLWQVGSKAAISKSIAISLIDLSCRDELKRHETSYLEALRHTCQHYAAQGYNVSLLSFCAGEGDEYATEKLREMCADEHVRCIHYQGNIQTMITCMFQAEFIIATRFHAMIIAWMLERKVLPLCYSPKMVHILDDMGYTAPFLSIDQISNHSDITRMMGSIHAPYDVSSSIRESENQFKLLDALVEQHRNS